MKQTALLTMQQVSKKDLLSVARLPPGFSSAARIQPNQPDGIWPCSSRGCTKHEPVDICISDEENNQ